MDQSDEDESGSPSSDDDVNDSDVAGGGVAASGAAIKKKAKQKYDPAAKKAALCNYNRPRVIVAYQGQQIDITQKHEAAGDEVTLPSIDKKSFYWNFFHVGVKDIEITDASGNAIRKLTTCAICNICGATILTRNRSYGAVEKHMCTVQHRELYKAACEQHAVTKSMVLQSPSSSSVNKRQKTGPPTTNKVTFERKKSLEEVEKEKADVSLSVLDAIVKYRAETFAPLKQFEHPSFRELLDVVAQCGRIGARHTVNPHRIGARTSALAEIGRSRLQQAVKKSIKSITADHWTSRRGHTHATLTVQYIGENFAINNLVIAVNYYLGPTTGEQILLDFKKDLQAWEIGPKDIPFLVTDTDANMNVVGISTERSKDDLMEHVYCLDHILQLIAKIAFDIKISGEALEAEDGLDDDSDIEDDDHGGIKQQPLMKKIRRLIAYFIQSSQAQEALESFAKKRTKDKDIHNKTFSLVQDDVTRWWSTLPAVERLLEMKETLILFFDATEEEQLKDWASKTSKGRIKSLPQIPNPDEWNALSQVTLLLSPFKDAQKTLSGNTYVTSSLAVPYLINIHRNLDKLCDDGDNEVVNGFARKMAKEFKKHFGTIEQGYQGNVVKGARQGQVGLHPSFYKAYALDPRTKGMKLLKSRFRDRIWNDLLDEIIAMGPPKDTPNVKNGKGGDSNAINSGRGGSGDGSSTDNVVAAFASPIKNTTHPEVEFEVGAGIAELMDDDDSETNAQQQREDEISYSTQCQVEMEKFQVSEGLNMYYERNNKKFVHDPLQSWWKGKSKDFPNIWRLARKYLAMPATAVSSERAFSIASLTSTTKQASMDPSSMADLHFLRENWGHIFGSNDTAN
ncbi:hypothetical protein ACA910_017961 [Epithemia clementina (nom. ined.)]